MKKQIKHRYNEQTRHDDNKRKKAKIRPKMSDSNLNFIIKLRHITTYLESGVTAAISKFLTFLTRRFFKLKTPTQYFRLKTTTSYLCYRILTTEKCCHLFGS